MVVDSKGIEADARHIVARKIFLDSLLGICPEIWRYYEVILKDDYSVVFIQQPSLFKYMGSQAKVALVFHHSLLAVTP